MSDVIPVYAYTRIRDYLHVIYTLLFECACTRTRRRFLPLEKRRWFVSIIDGHRNHQYTFKKEKRKKGRRSIPYVFPKLRLSVRDILNYEYVIIFPFKATQFSSYELHKIKRTTTFVGCIIHWILSGSYGIYFRLKHGILVIIFSALVSCSGWHEQHFFKFINTFF